MGVSLLISRRKQLRGVSKPRSEHPARQAFQLPPGLADGFGRKVALSDARGRGRIHPDCWFPRCALRAGALGKRCTVNRARVWVIANRQPEPINVVTEVSTPDCAFRHKFTAQLA